MIMKSSIAQTALRRLSGVLSIGLVWIAIYCHPLAAQVAPVGGGSGGGNWLVTTTVIASSYYSDGNAGTQSELPKPAMAVAVAPNAVASLTVNAVYTVQAQWVGAGAPPAKVYIAVTPKSYWQWNPTNTLANEFPQSSDAADGYADTQTLNESLRGGLLSPTGLAEEDGTSTKTHLIQATVNSLGLAIVPLPSMQSQVAVNTSLGGALVASCTLVAAADTRSVIITSALDQSANYSKGASGAPALNVRNSDGSMRVDTVITGSNISTVNLGPSPVPPMIEVQWQLGLGLFAQTTGFDVTTTNLLGNIINTSVSWSGNSNPGSGQVDYSILSPLSATLNASGLIVPGPCQLPAIATTSVHAEDVRPGMDAVADNQYIVYIHNNLENPVFAGPAVFDHDQCFPWSGWQPITNSTVKLPVVKLDGNGTWSTGANNPGLAFFFSGVCGSGSVAILAELAGLSEPAGWAVAVCDITMSLIGYSVSAAGSIDGTDTESYTVGWTDFKTSVSDQQAIYNWTDALSPTSGPIYFNLHNTNVVNDVDDNRFPGVTESEFYDQIANNQSYAFNNCVSQVQARQGWRHNQRPINYDAYNASGYIGIVSGLTVYPHIIWSPVCQWQFSILPPPQSGL